MRYREIVQASARQRMIDGIKRAGTALGLKGGFVDDARRAATPYVVDCPDLSREMIGDREFEKQFSERRDWCEERCYDNHEIESIRDQRMRLVGRRFRFANEGDAALFRMLFP
jgi:hypothetical protein